MCLIVLLLKLEDVYEEVYSRSTLTTHGESRDALLQTQRVKQPTRDLKFYVSTRICKKHLYYCTYVYATILFDKFAYMFTLGDSVVSV